MEKLLSIIVPSYNMEKYLPKCLSSLIVDDTVLLQKLDVIVVNDGSKDRTSEIAHDFERRYPGVVRVIDKPNGNYGSCINAAIPVARGHFVKVLDADDTFDAKAFAEFLQALHSLPQDTDLVMSDYVRVNEDGREIRTCSYDLPTDAAFAVSELIARQCDVQMHAVCYRTGLMQEIGYRQTEGISYTDAEWVYLPVAASGKMRYVRQPVYRYLLGRGGQTMENATFVKNRWMLEKILRRMLQQYGESKSGNAYDESYLMGRIIHMTCMLIFLYVAKVRYGELQKSFSQFRDVINGHRFLENAISEYCLFGNFPIRIRFVRCSVRHPWLAAPLVFAFRSYCKIRHSEMKLV